MSLAQKRRGGFAEMWQVDAEVELKLTFSPWFLGMWLAFIPAQTVLILSCCSLDSCVPLEEKHPANIGNCPVFTYSDSDLASPVLERCTKVSKKKKNSTNPFWACVWTKIQSVYQDLTCPRTLLRKVSRVLYIKEYVYTSAYWNT